MRSRASVWWTCCDRSERAKPAIFSPSIEAPTRPARPPPARNARRACSDNRESIGVAAPDDIGRAQELLGRAIGRARIGEDRELANRVRELGERLAHLLLGLLRMTRMHSPDNHAFDRPVEELIFPLRDTLARIRRVVREPGRPVSAETRRARRGRVRAAMGRRHRHERELADRGPQRVAPQSIRVTMSILSVLIPLALLLLGLAVWAFFWAVGSGQFDDLDTPAVRVVMDDDTKPAEDDKT